MFNVVTNHQVIPFGRDLMALFDSESSAQLVTATRTDGIWTISAEGVEDRTADNRPDAITALIEQALAKLGPSGPDGRGYSTTVPHGLADQP